MSKWKNPVQSLVPTMEPTAEDLIFAAGFYEGEGSCVVNHGTVNCVIPQKDPEMLYWLKERWGGSVRCYRLHQWTLTGNRGRLFLQAIYPYLSKRRKCQIDSSSAWRLSKNAGALVGGMDQERAAARDKMTAKERRNDTARQYVSRHREQVNANARACVARNRDQHNAKVRAWRAARKLTKQSMSEMVQ